VVDLLNERFPKTKESGNWQTDYDLFHLQNSLELTSTINQMIQIPDEKGAFKDALADLRLKELLIRLFQTQASQWLMMQAEFLKTSHRLAAVITYVRDNLHENIKLDTLAGIACMSRPHFFRSFKREIGMSPLDFIHKERLAKAKLLLKNVQWTISEIAIACGFQNLPWFSLQFKKQTGKTPSQFRSDLVLNKQINF
jgi:transcriptional regulator GlxA family with amidase domain